MHSLHGLQALTHAMNGRNPILFTSLEEFQVVIRFRAYCFLSHKFHVALEIRSHTHSNAIIRYQLVTRLTTMKLLTSPSIFVLVLTTALIPSSETFNVQPNTCVVRRTGTPSWSTKTSPSRTESTVDGKCSSSRSRPSFSSSTHRNENVLTSPLFGRNHNSVPSLLLSKIVWSTLSVVLVSLYRILVRTDATLERAGFHRNTTMTAGIGSSVSGLVEKAKSLPNNIRNLKLKDLNPIKIIKGLHGPITYLVLAVVAASKYKWMWRNPAWWFGVAFCVKWFRARYVFKIPVWDRQPNWNNVITSKEQEKDLKAYTCKKCGSTIFIAKTREFFFEGSTGIGGLGCFSCGAKGAENFVMDRDRIVEDVSDIDDYFEYERPLDFISRAERRALMREAGGDEDKANQILIERTNAQASDESQSKADAIVNGGGAKFEASPAVVDSDPKTSSDDTQEATTAVDDSDAVESASETILEPIKEEKKEKKEKKKKQAVPSSTPKTTVDKDDDLDALDALGMDDI